MRAFCTDLDGTLRDPEGGIPARNLAALEELGRRAVVRVVVTGRSLHHARQVLPEQTPIDWLIFASGAGHLRWPDGEPDVLPALDGEELRALAAALALTPLSYSLHEAAPHSHRFAWRQVDGDATDFLRRLERNRLHGRPLDGRPLAEEFPAGVSQALVFAPAGQGWEKRLAVEHPALEMIHSTSPLDHRSQWIELQPKGIRKSTAAARLLEGALGIPARHCRALGNDHNDGDLLAWAGAAAVVANAPAELQERYRVVADCREAGAAQAIEDWLAEEA